MDLPGKIVRGFLDRDKHTRYATVEQLRIYTHSALRGGCARAYIYAFRAQRVNT